MSYDAYQSYQAVDLGAQTAKASPLELVLILMTGLLDELARARAHIEHARFEAKAKARSRGTGGRAADRLRWLPAAPESEASLKARDTFRRVMAIPEAQRTPLQLLRTDSQAFIDATEARRNRVDGFYTIPVGHIDLCNIPLPVR